MKRCRGHVDLAGNFFQLRIRLGVLVHEIDGWAKLLEDRQFTCIGLEAAGLNQIPHKINQHSVDFAQCGVVNLKLLVFFADLKRIGSIGKGLPDAQKRL